MARELLEGSYRWLLATALLLGLEPWSSGGATMLLTVEPSLQPLLYYFALWLGPYSHGFLCPHGSLLLWACLLFVLEMGPECQGCLLGLVYPRHRAECRAWPLCKWLC